MNIRSKEEIAIIKQKMLDFCTEFKKTGEIARALNVPCATINSYAYDLYFNGNYLERIPERTATKTMTWAYKTIKPIYKHVSNAVNAREEGKWKYVHCSLFGHEPIQHDIVGRKFKADDKPENSEYVQHLKDADERRRKENKKHTTKGVFVSGSTLHMAV